MEGSIAGELELSLVEGSDCRSEVEERYQVQGSFSGGGERSQVEASDRRWRGTIAGGGERSQTGGLEWGEIAGGWERSQVEGSDRRWRGATQVEGNNRKWRGEIAGALPRPGRPKGALA